jgi:hypothetical protein
MKAIPSNKWHRPWAVRAALVAVMLVFALLGHPIPAVAGVVGMIIDNENRFSVAQALVATAVSTDLIDLGADRDIGIGEPMVVVVTVDVAAAGGGTLQVTVQADDNSGFASPGTVAQTGQIAAATLVAGYKFAVQIPPDLLTERFLRLNYTLVTMTGITLTASLIPQNFMQADAYGASGFTVK